MGCTSNHDSTTSRTDKFTHQSKRTQHHPSNETLQTLILEGNGTLSDQSLGFRFPNLQTLHIEFAPDVQMTIPEDIALWTQIKDVRIYGTAISQLPKALGDLPIQTLRIEHNPYLERFLIYMDHSKESTLPTILFFKTFPKPSVNQKRFSLFLLPTTGFEAYQIASETTIMSKS